MSSLDISLIAFGCLLGGVLFGMWMRYLLPDHHLSKESQDTVKLGAGMVATMSAMILGLLVSSSKSSFDAVNATIAQNGAKTILADRLLAEYGPEAHAVRAMMKQSLASQMERIWSKQKNGPTGLRAIELSNALEDFQNQLRGLNPSTDMQKSLLAQVRQLDLEIWQSRLVMIEQQQQGLPPTLIVLLVFWLTLLFASFGLFAPRNVTVCAVLVVCAVAVASAIFLILEMSHPLDGFIRASNAPLLKALEMIGR